ncbi:MAG: hypothetical protein HeimC3_04250 [Candidatus Heimdallarchaeota archaeon LC_3]|nr:MAG: hypothetical protein HeimC3_04250 [Candidatus Heimdallarchaeota archaeon LC_3]
MNNKDLINTIILGIGNKNRSDDGIGSKIISKMKILLHPKSIIFEDLSIRIFDIDYYLKLYPNLDYLIIIDAIIDNKIKIGTIITLELDNPVLKGISFATSTHNINIIDYLLMYKSVNAQIFPKKVIIIGVVVENTQLGEVISKEVELSIDKIINYIEYMITNKTL